MSPAATGPAGPTETGGLSGVLNNAHFRLCTLEVLIAAVPPCIARVWSDATRNAFGVDPDDLDFFLLLAFSASMQAVCLLFVWTLRWLNRDRRVARALLMTSDRTLMTAKKLSDIVEAKLYLNTTAEEDLRRVGRAQPTRHYLVGSADALLAEYDVIYDDWSPDEIQEAFNASAAQDKAAHEQMARQERISRLLRPLGRLLNPHYEDAPQPLPTAPLSESTPLLSGAAASRPPPLSAAAAATDASGGYVSFEEYIRPPDSTFWGYVAHPRRLLWTPGPQPGIVFAPPPPPPPPPPRRRAAAARRHSSLREARTPASALSASSHIDAAGSDSDESDGELVENVPLVIESMDDLLRQQRRQQRVLQQMTRQREDDAKAATARPPQKDEARFNFFFCFVDENGARGVFGMMMGWFWVDTIVAFFYVIVFPAAWPVWAVYLSTAATLASVAVLYGVATPWLVRNLPPWWKQWAALVAYMVAVSMSDGWANAMMYAIETALPNSKAGFLFLLYAVAIIALYPIWAGIATVLGAIIKRTVKRTPGTPDKEWGLITSTQATLVNQTCGWIHGTLTMEGLGILLLPEGVYSGWVLFILAALHTVLCAFYSLITSYWQATHKVTGPYVHTRRTLGKIATSVLLARSFAACIRVLFEVLNNEHWLTKLLYFIFDVVFTWFALATLIWAARRQRETEQQLAQQAERATAVLEDDDGDDVEAGAAAPAGVAPTASSSHHGEQRASQSASASAER